MNDRLTAFGNQLIESHIRLREWLGQLRDGTYTGVDLQTHCLTFCAKLTSHHEAEDSNGFPVLAKHYPELAPVLDALSADHRQVGDALARLGELADFSTNDAVRELDTVAALLETHLVYEEKKLVDALNRLTATETETRAVRKAVTVD